MQRESKFVESQLKGLPKVRKSGDNVFICCPFHPQDDTPSLEVYAKVNGKLSLGTYYCFGCGASGGWNELADVLKLAPLPKDLKYKQTTQTSIDLGALKAEALTYSNTMKLPKTSKWHLGPWRGVSEKTVKKVGGRQAIGKLELILPVKVRKRLISYVRAAVLKKKGVPSYLLAKNSRLKERGLYPFDCIGKLAKKSSHIVLVEGPRDALRLMDSGLPALAIFGTQGWSQQKRELLLSICSQHEAHPLVMMDGDAPGQRAQVKILNDLRKHSKSVGQVNLSKFSSDMDPANMPLDLLNKLKFRLGV